MQNLKFAPFVRTETMSIFREVLWGARFPYIAQEHKQDIGFRPELGDN